MKYYREITKDIPNVDSLLNKFDKIYEDSLLKMEIDEDSIEVLRSDIINQYI